MSTTPPPSHSSSPELSEVPGKPGWLRSAVIDGDYKVLREERNRIAKSFDPKAHHVFWGWNPGDEAQPPPGWLERQREDFERRSLRGLPPAEIEAMMRGVTFPYYPTRVFVVPRAAMSDVVRTFRVGTNNQADEEVMNATAVRVDAIDRIVPVGIVYAGNEALTLVFLEPASQEQCREIEKLFPFMEEGDVSLGMEDYLSNWSPDEGEWFLARRFQQDQGVNLWWD